MTIISIVYAELMFTMVVDGKIELYVFIVDCIV